MHPMSHGRVNGYPLTRIRLRGVTPPNPMIHEEIFEEQTSESLLALLVIQNHVISQNFVHVLILSRYNLCVAIQPVTPIRNVIQSE